MTDTRQANQTDIPAEWNRVTERIIGCEIEVHSLLGPGLFEHVYEVALARELQLAGLSATRQQPLTCTYKGVPLPDLRLDIVVENLVIVELKSVESVHDAHLAQLVSHLRYTNLPLGLLINFNVPKLVLGIHRRIFPPAIARLSTLPTPRSSALL